MVENVTKKIIRSGDVVEVYEYEKGYWKGYEVKDSNGGRKKDYESEEYLENRKKVIQRANKEMRRLINSNIGVENAGNTLKFLTLTFKENIQDHKTANYEFTKFIKKMNYKITGKNKAYLRYLVKVEKQKRGAIHYHVILFNMPYIKHNELLELWKQGGVYVNKIKEEHIDNYGAYILGYFKDEEKGQGAGVDDDFLKGKKSYFTSRNIIKPTEIIEKNEIAEFEASLSQEQEKYSATFENEHLGQIVYKQYNIKK